MKKSIRIVCISAILAMALFSAAGCKAANTQSNQGGSGQGPSGALPAGMSGTRGVITQVSGTSVTIAVMPQGTGGNGGQMPSGSGGPNGTLPANGGPQGSGGPDRSAMPGASMSPIDTSSWEKQTFTIDGSTKITQGQAPGSNAGSTALKASDLKTGDSVVIAERSGKAGVADEITVMQGMGGFGGGPGGAPAATTNSSNT